MSLQNIDYGSGNNTETGDDAYTSFQKLEANDSYLEQLIINNNTSVENRYVTPPNNNTAAMIADQSNQTQGKFNYVADATDDPSFVTPPSGNTRAYYEKLSTSTGQISDYRLLTENEALVVVTNGAYNVFQVKSKELSYSPASVQLGYFLIEFENVGNKITFLYFDETFSRYISGVEEADSSAIITIRLINKTAESTHIVNVVSYEQINSGANYKVGIVQDVDESAFNIDDVVRVEFDISASEIAEEDIIGHSVAYTEADAELNGDLLLDLGSFAACKIHVDSADVNLVDTTGRPAVNQSFERRFDLSTQNGAEAINLPVDWIQNGQDLDLSAGVVNCILVKYSNYAVGGLIIHWRRIKTITERNLKGLAVYDAAVTGTYDLDLDTFDDAYYILTGNTDLTASNTPAVGESVVKNLIVKSAVNETLSVPGSWGSQGSYNADGSENFITIKFANYPTVGLVVNMYINVND